MGCLVIIHSGGESRILLTIFDAATDLKSCSALLLLLLVFFAFARLLSEAACARA